jgi:diguanylate cyclase (GGDEF)-like protein
MLQMVTNLAAIALIHTGNIRALQSQANHDGLTGLFNKRHFMQNLGFMINDAEGSAKPLGLFIFDIDHFKQYNDTNGHPAGDELLKSLAHIVRANLRPGDLACRYGGEEFVVAMPDTDGVSTLNVAERIRQAIEKHRFAHEESQPGGRLTISGGVAYFPVDGTNGTELLSHADQALYRAKATGRNRVIRYEGVEIGDAGRKDEPKDEEDSGFFPRESAANDR